MASPDWHVSMVHSHLSEESCGCTVAGHAGVRGTDRADSLAGKATITGGLRLGRPDVLRSLRHYLLAQGQGYHTIDRLEERGVEIKRKSSMIFLERRRKGHRQPDQHWNCFKSRSVCQFVSTES